MKTYKTINQRKEVRDKVYCDNCGEVIKSESMYEAFESKFVFQIGHIFPEKGLMERLTNF